MTIGTYVEAGTAGKWVKNANATKYIVCGDPIVEANGTLYPIMRVEA